MQPPPLWRDRGWRRAATGAKSGVTRVSALKADAASPGEMPAFGNGRRHRGRRSDISRVTDNSWRLAFLRAGAWIAQAETVRA
ncbi:hypothetical protein BRAO375_300013 [Bradyrhizobium sp. ORS 375]|nr:hypothetical protein BRAO375_300013 [Bradyrhizobium sp. ORS 375]